MKENLKEISIDDISPNPYQPRLSFNQAELNDLASSIKENGLIQPIIVRKSPIFGYELIAGERRLKACQIAGLTTIPAIIKEISNQESMQLAIVENLQRTDLNPIEEAKAYQQLLTKKQMTHEELAQFMGKSRPYITNCLRLLKLPISISQALEIGKISQGHARLLISLSSQTEQEKWFQKIVTDDLSVRGLEKAIKQHKKEKIVKETPKKDLFKQDKEKELSQLLGFPVTLTLSKDGIGYLHLPFDSDETLNKLINKLK